jgi:transposase
MANQYSDSQPYHDKDTLERLYHGESMTAEEIGDKFGVSQSCISTWMKRNNIDTRSSEETREMRGTHHRPIKEGPHTDKEWLREKYHGEKMTLEEMADEAGLKSEVSIMEWMDRFGIDRRKKSVAFTLANIGAGFVHADASGYETVKHSVDDTTKNYKIHRLVAMAHYGIEEVKDSIVHHKNGVPWDNRPENLEVLDDDKEHMRKHMEMGMYEDRGRPDAPRDEKGRFIG